MNSAHYSIRSNSPFYCFFSSLKVEGEFPALSKNMNLVVRCQAQIDDPSRRYAQIWCMG